MTIRPAQLCRSWQFIGGPQAASTTARDSGGDVVVLDLEDFTPPDQRGAARASAPGLFAAWRKTGARAGVRINPLDADGATDLPAVMAGAPDVVMLPKVSGPRDISALANAISVEENRLGIAAGQTWIVPNVETASALFQVREIATADARVVACLLASEDMTTDLGAPRSREGTELAFARGHFHAACCAAGVVSIDYPYTFADQEGLEASCAGARAVGYQAKAFVTPTHGRVINAAFTPSRDAVAKAQAIVSAFDTARAEGRDRVELDGHLIEVPTWRNAQNTLSRARSLTSHDCVIL